MGHYHRSLVLVLCLALAACGDVPRPFQPKPEDAPNPLSQPVGSFEIRVEPVDGIALPMGKLLAHSVARGLTDLDIPTTDKPLGSSRYILKGLAEPNWKDTRAPFTALIHWTLFDPEGEQLGTHIQGIRGKWWNWENGDPRIIVAVGTGAARPIAAMIREEMIRTPVELMGTGMIVRPIEGAPGDGNVALLRAIKDAMRSADVSITDDPRQATFTLQGFVTVDPPFGSRQRVRVVWTVFTLYGDEVGNAVQESLVKRGSLDGAWGSMARKVAVAAVDGIESILGRARAGERRGPLPLLPATPELRRVPGRALPPPQ